MAQHPHHTDLSGFGFVEASELTWREKGQQIAIGLGFAVSVFTVFGPLLVSIPVAPLAHMVSAESRL